MSYRNITFLDNKTTRNLSKFLNYQVRKNLWSGVLNDNAYQSCGGALGAWKFPATKQVIFKILMLTNYQYFCMITQCKITWNKLIELEHVEKIYIYILTPALLQGPMNSGLTICLPIPFVSPFGALIDSILWYRLFVI